jgi:carboxymethylenebutenolidase
MAESIWKQVDTDNSTMRMHVSFPTGSSSFPAVVVTQHQGGVDEFVQNITRRLAESGYVAAAPDLYHRDGPKCTDDIVTRRTRLRDRNIINDVNATLAFLQQHDSVDGSRMALIGFFFFFLLPSYVFISRFFF